MKFYPSVDILLFSHEQSLDLTSNAKLRGRY